jgi:peroxiredoxin
LNGFSLADSTGEIRSLSSLKGEKGTLIVFISTKCPYSNAYNERMEKIARDYKPRGVSFVGVNANAHELPEEIKRHATQHGLTFPILKDEGNKLADELGARVTPQAFLVDSGNNLIYQGRVDNSKNIEQVKSHDLRDALEAFLSGAPIEKPTMRAFGCTIERVKSQGAV